MKIIRLVLFFILIVPLVLAGCKTDGAVLAPVIPPPPGVVDKGNQTPPAVSVPDGGPAKTPTELVSGQDLEIVDISWVPLAPSPMDSVSFNVTIRNYGDQSVGLFTVSLIVDGEQKGLELVRGLESDTIIQKRFRWRFQNDSVVQIVVDSGAVISEGNEADNVKTIPFSQGNPGNGGSSAPATDNASSSDNSTNPDLMVCKISWSPMNPKFGDIVSYNVTLANRGNQSAGPFSVVFLVDHEQQVAGLIPQLSVNATANRTFAWRVQDINYTVGVIVDSGHTVFESDETNNAVEVAFSDIPRQDSTINLCTTDQNLSANASLPDLVIEQVTYLPAKPLPQEAVSFNVTLRNLGDTDAGAFTVRWYVSPYYAAQNRYQSFPGLPAGNQTLIMQFDWWVQLGETSLLFVVDSGDDVNEQNEDNNRFEIIISDVEIPDLLVESIVWEPESPSVGENVTFSVNIHNISHRDTDAFWSTYYVDGVRVATGNYSALAGGANYTGTFIWQAQPGQHVIEAVLDEAGTINESDESNNRRQVIYTGTLLADLTVDEIIWSPLNPLANEVCVYSVTVRNSGPGTADPAQLRLSIGDGWVNSRAVPFLASGETWTDNFTWIAELGKHAVRAVVNSDGAVPEDNMDNNQLALSFSHASPLIPDLAVSELVLSPENPVANDELALHIKILNNGTQSSTPCFLHLIVDGQLEATIPVWSVTSGGYWATTHHFRTSAGEHQIKVVIDTENTVAEADETNNLRELVIQVG
jgi:subtilase family serine protease